MENLNGSERGGDLGGRVWFESPRVGPENCPTRKFLTEYTGAPLRLSRGRNLKRSERGRPRGGKSVV